MGSFTHGIQGVVRWLAAPWDSPGWLLLTKRCDVGQMCPCSRYQYGGTCRGTPLATHRQMHTSQVHPGSPHPAPRYGQLPVGGQLGIGPPAVGARFGGGPPAVNQEVCRNSVQEHGEWLSLRCTGQQDPDTQPRVMFTEVDLSHLHGDEHSDTGFMGTGDTDWPDRPQPGCPNWSLG